MINIKTRLQILSAGMFLLLTNWSIGQSVKTAATKPTSSAGQMKWTVDPFDYKIFIENRGQFDKATENHDKILFQSQLGGVYICFTPNGIIYRYDEWPKKPYGASDEDNDEAEVANVKPKTHYLRATWEGSNSNVTVDAQQKQTYYESYGLACNHNIKANVYKKIVYHNMYPGIDVEYTFPKDKGGFKYALVVHPGADLSAVKLKYDGAKNISTDEAGNVNVESDGIGTFTDHAPVSFYDENSMHIESGFKLENMTESFYAKPALAGKTLVIDPWIMNPKLDSNNKGAYDLDYDVNGNVYVYGAYSPYRLDKISKLGVLIWQFTASIYNSPGYYGDMACDKPSGTCYLAEGFNSSPGARILKVNSNGALVDTFLGDVNMREMWRAVENPCNRTIICGGGGTNPQPYNAFILDTNCNKISAVNTTGANNCCHDISLMAVDPNGLYCYMSPALRVGDANHNNTILKSPLPTLTPNVWESASDGFKFQEVGSIKYVGNILGEANGMNGMAASPNWLYAYDGDSVKKFNKATGAHIQSRIVSVGSNPAFKWGGLDADVLDNVYAGFNDSIYIYNSNLVLQSGIKMPNTVFDVVLAPPTLAYACGIGFVSEFTIPHVKLIQSTTGSPSSCSACDGKATVTNVFGGMPPFTYSWSNGETGATDSLLCAGLYTVTVMDASCPPYSDTAIISVSASPGYLANLVDTNPSGCRGKMGSITAFPTGGTPAYTYLWSNGATTQKDTGLAAGNYTVTVTDANGCKYVTYTTIVNPVPSPVSVSPSLDSLCIGSSVLIQGSGVSQYSWSPATDLSCNNCPNPMASPTVTTTYTVTGTDSNGCTSTATATIAIKPIPNVTIVPPTDTICKGNGVVITAMGATSYTWTPGTGLSCTACPNPLASPTITTQYTVIGTSNRGCTDTARINLVVTPLPTATLTVSPANDTICRGDSALLKVAGGCSYKWTFNNSTSDSIWVKPPATNTYFVQVTCNGCSIFLNQLVHVIGSGISSVTGKDTICNGDSTAWTGNGGTTYKWLSPYVTNNPVVYVKANGTYSCVISSPCGIDTIKKTLKVMPLPVIGFTGDTAICAGNNATFNASGGASYTWTPAGSGLSCYNCPNPTATPTVSTTYTLTIANGSCAHDTVIHLSVNKPNDSINHPPRYCVGGCVTLNAYGGGTYQWNNGATTSSITVCPTSDSTYKVTILSHGCPITDSTRVFVDAPLLTTSGNDTIKLGDTAHLHAYGAQGYVWSPATGLSCTTCPNPIADPSVTTTYTVTSTDSVGCPTSRTLTVFVETPCADFNVPNVFTPNDDGINDDFVVTVLNPSSYSIVIYDRWGKQMYTSTDATVYWNGRINGTQNLAPDGTYYYIIKASCQSNNYVKKGFVQLVGEKK